MRTTLTLDDDVARMLEEEAHLQRKSFKEVVNDALRRGLSPTTRRRQPPFKVRVHHARLQPGIDPAGFNRLADELESEAVVRKLRRRSR